MWCIGIRVWEDRCQAIKCAPEEPATSMVLAEDSYPLPFANLQGTSPVPLIVFAIATHMMLHPDSDLLEVLGLRKSVSDARQDATVDYRSTPPPADLSCIQ